MMPRRRTNGSRGSSPDKPQSARGRGGVHVNQTVSQSQNKKSSNHKADLNKEQVQTLDQNDETCKTLQEMFKGRIDPDVVQLVLSESDWNGEKAFESLSALVQELPVVVPQDSHMPINQNQPQPAVSARQNKPQSRPQIELRSRLPTANEEPSNEANSLPVLSPRTPMVIDPNFFPLGHNATSDMQSAMAALHMYGQNVYLEEPEQGQTFLNDRPLQSEYQGHGRDYLKPGRGTNDVHQTQNIHQFEQMAPMSHNTQTVVNMSRPSPQVSPQPPFPMMSSNYMTHVNDLQRQKQHVPVNQQRQNSNSNSNSQFDGYKPHVNHNAGSIIDSNTVVQADRKGKQQLTSVRQQASSPVSKRQSLRKHTVSLNPEERESLEKLIDEVLQQGFSEDFNDSDSSDTDVEEPVSPNSGTSTEGQDKKKNNNNNKEKKVGGKQPSTLKVAAKHMKNIPPRFLKKLQAIQTTGKSEEEGVTFTDENIALIVNGGTEEELDQQLEEEKLSLQISTVEQPLPTGEVKINLGSQINVEKQPVIPDVTSLPQAYMPSPIIQAPMPLSCEELERNLLGVQPSQGKTPDAKPDLNFSQINTMEVQHPAMRKPPLTPDSVDRRYLEAMRENLDRKTAFSVNAPEFVPKSQRPGLHGEMVPTSSPPVAVAPIVSQPYSLLAGVHTAGGRFSPQTTRLQTSNTPERNTPSPGAQFIVSKGPQITPAVSGATTGGVPLVPPYQPPPAYPVHHYVNPYGSIYRTPFITPHPYQEQKTQANLVAHYQGAHMFMPQPVPPGAKIPGKDQNWAQMLTGVRAGAASPLGMPRMPTSPQLSARQDLHNQAQKLRQKVLEMVKAGKKVMIIIRGLPGSGKSTLARELRLNCPVFSADDFFMTNGKYEYDYGKIGEAHEACQRKAKQSVEEDKNPIIIDNTHVMAWEMKYYITLATEYEYEIEILEPDTPWKFKPRELARKNIHGVQFESIQRMASRYDRQITLEKIAKSIPKEREEIIQWQKENQAAPADGEKKEEKRRGRRRRKRQRRKKTKGNIAAVQSAEKIDSSDNKDTQESSSDSDIDTASSKSLPLKGEEVNNNKDKEAAVNTSVRSGSVENACVTSEGSVRSGSENTSVRSGSVENASVPSEGSLRSESDITSVRSGSVENTCIPASEGSIRSRSVESSKDAGNELDTIHSIAKDMSDGVFSADDVTAANIEKDDGGVVAKEQNRILVDDESNTQKDKNVQDNEVEEGSNDEEEEIFDAAELRAEIETIIKERIMEHVLNEEVANITEGADEKLMKEKLESLDKKVEGYLSQLSVSSATAETHSPNSQATIAIDPSTELQYWNSNTTDAYTVQVAGVVSSVTAPEGWVNSTNSMAQDWQEANHGTIPKIQRQKHSNKFVKKNINVENGQPSQSSSTESANISPENNSGNEQNVTTSFTNSETTSPKKSRRSQKSPPKLQQELKNELMSNDWEVCEFPAGDNVNMFKSNPVLTTDVIVVEHSTCTDPKDFAAVQRLAAGENPSNIPSNILSVLTCRPRIISDSVLKNSLNLEQGPIKVFKLTVDKSTNTEELGLLGRGVEFLNNCFPSIDSQDLSEVLEKCAGDVQWAVNVLLDAGYEYNEQSSPQENQQLYESNLTEEIGDIDSLTVTTPHKSNVDETVKLSPTSPLRTPPPLSLLSLKLIPSPEILLQDHVQHNVVQNSLHRLESIDEFHHQHQHEEDGLSQLAMHDAQYDQIYMSDDDLAETPDDKSESQSEKCEESGGMESTDDTAGIIDTVVELEQCQPSMEEQEDLMLTLSPELTWQLEKLFGSPIPKDHRQDEYKDYREVRLNRKTARQIHHQWTMTLKERIQWEQHEKHRQLHDDEALARRLQEEEELGHSTNCVKAPISTNRNQSSPKKRSRNSSPIKVIPSSKRDGCVVSFERVPPPPRVDSLHDIMQEERAMEESRNEYVTAQQASSNGAAMSTLLKQKKLEEMFPGIDHTVLMEIFIDHSFELGPTIEALSGSYGATSSAASVMTPEAKLAYEEYLVQQAVNASLQGGSQSDTLYTKEATKKYETTDSAPYQALEGPAYQDFRAEAEHHRQLRQECFCKAQDAYRRGMKPVASFYAQQGHLHTERMKEANRRAAEQIIETRNEDLKVRNQLDLHLLHVDEAVEMLDRVLTERQAELSLLPGKRKGHILVVTGRGNHSIGGVAKIRPAILEYIKRKNHRYTEPNAGTLKVYLR